MEYGAYRVTISPYCTPKVELLYSSDDSEECLQAAHNAAHDMYCQHGYSLNMGIIPLKTKWIVYNTLSSELDVFYACRGNKE